MTDIYAADAEEREAIANFIAEIAARRRRQIKTVSLRSVLVSLAFGEPDRAVGVMEMRLRQLRSVARSASNDDRTRWTYRLSKLSPPDSCLARLSKLLAASENDMISSPAHDLRDAINALERPNGAR